MMDFAQFKRQGAGVLRNFTGVNQYFLLAEKNHQPAESNDGVLHPVGSNFRQNKKNTLASSLTVDNAAFENVLLWRSEWTNRKRPQSCSDRMIPSTRLGVCSHSHNTVRLILWWVVISGSRINPRHLFRFRSAHRHFQFAVVTTKSPAGKLSH